MANTSTRIDFIRLGQQRAVCQLRESISLVAAEISHFLNDVDEHDRDQDSDKALERPRMPCTLIQDVVIKCHMELVQSGIWKPLCYSLGLTDLTHRIEALELPAYNDTETCSYCTQTPAEVMSKFEDELDFLDNRASDVFAGVCLDCFKAGRESGMMCRVKHRG